MVYYILYFYLPALWFRRAWGEDTLNSRKPQKFAEPGLRMCLLIMLIFALVTFFFARFNRYIAYGEAVVTVLLAIYALIRARARQKELQAFVENVTYNAESATNNTLIHFPLPMAVFRLNDSGVVWGNQPFWEMCGRTSPAFDAKLASLVPEFNSKWLLEGKNRMADLLEVDGKKYQVNGNMVRAGEREETYEFMGITYWVDVTEYDDVKQEYLATRPVVMVMLVDNYDELMKPLTDRQRTELRGQLDIAIEKWCEGRGGILRRVDRDRYIFIFEKRHFDEITKNRFTLVESIHSIVNLTGIYATVSIGVGLDGASYDEDYSFATLAEDMALSRGGDQAVVKNKFNFEFFGGRGAEVETRTKVKSRVMANAFAELIKDSSKVLVMGHRFGDLDSIGAAVGVCCLARQLGVHASIVADTKHCAATPLIDMVRCEPEYKDIFLTPQEAPSKVDAHTLLAVVDTNRPEQVECPDLLNLCKRVAVIDHHRVAATYIHDAALGFIEPYASSACELMTEIIQELPEAKDMLRCEAEALMSGIVLDTKGFTIRTGERTFYAAAVLRRHGADTAAVKRLFQSDMEDTVAKYKILQSAKLYRKVAVAAPEEPQERVVAAQAADELLNVSGVDASIVVAPDGKGGVFASARSIGELNVQLIMEKLGGGGNRSAAAVQFQQGETLKEAVSKIYAAIDDYFA